eukprot:1377211-Amorphochlora_amoeboformis.AAC.2
MIFVIRPHVSMDLLVPKVPHDPPKKSPWPRDAFPNGVAVPCVRIRGYICLHGKTRLAQKASI